MAYNASNEDVKVIATIDKNTRGDKIQIQLIRNKISNAEMIDIRQMYTPEGTDALAPTRKGIRFNVELLSEIVAGLVSVLDDDSKEELIAQLEGGYEDNEDGSDEGEQD